MSVVNKNAQIAIPTPMAEREKGKGKRCRGRGKFRHEGVGTMWYCSKERKPDIGIND